MLTSLSSSKIRFFYSSILFLKVQHFYSIPAMSGYQFSRAIPGLALRASKLAGASGLLMIRRSLSPSPVRQIHTGMICRTNSGWLN